MVHPSIQVWNGPDGPTHLSLRSHLVQNTIKLNNLYHSPNEWISFTCAHGIAFAKNLNNNLSQIKKVWHESYVDHSSVFKPFKSKPASIHKCTISKTLNVLYVYKEYSYKHLEWSHESNNPDKCEEIGKSDTETLRKK